jgi:hypothetical protein
MGCATSICIAFISNKSALGLRSVTGLTRIQGTRSLSAVETNAKQAAE